MLVGLSTVERYVESGTSTVERIVATVEMDVESGKGLVESGSGKR